MEANDAYVDSARLVQLDRPVLRGAPRVQYPREYHLLPPDATLAEGQRVFEVAHASKGTVGSSADDAGVGARASGPRSGR